MCAHVVSKAIVSGLIVEFSVKHSNTRFYLHLIMHKHFLSNGRGMYIGKSY